MTTMAMSMTKQEMTGCRPSLEELVDRMMDALLGGGSDEPAPSVARSVHDARRMRRSGDLDGALAVLGGVDPRRATDREARWAYAEWLGLARRRFGSRETLVYSQGTGRAAALAPRTDGALVVVAAVGMRWRPGRVVSRRSLRGLRPLAGGE